MEFEDACSEMYYILEHLNPTDKKKIPESVIKFFKDNKSIFYKVDLDVNKKLREQDLKDETKAFIQIINEKYFKEKNVEEIKNNYLEEDSFINLSDNEQNEIIEHKELIIRKKENKLVEWIKKVFKKLGMKY